MLLYEVEVINDASGAARAAARGNITVVVDVINMSTTLEAVLEAGAIGVFGASPDETKAPVNVDPENIGFEVGCIAKEKNTEVILITEPRVGTDLQRRRNASRALSGIRRVGLEVIRILPNIGAETVKMANFKNKVVLAVTDTGGVAFDAAYNAGGIVTTATIARTLKMKGVEPAYAGAKRALSLAREKKASISVVAASGNSLEDVLAAKYIAQIIKKLINRQ